MGISTKDRSIQNEIKPVLLHWAEVIGQVRCLYDCV